MQDQVIKVDTDSGEVSLLVDFGDLFPITSQSTDHSGIDESDPTRAVGTGSTSTPSSSWMMVHVAVRTA